ncbi:YceD family protein [Fervidibacillus albus]|uniref:YceD family protein n=1 Tax=Fervidibacillus albus TaxID=2980026 RepID=A0A9E8LVS8_9BACI|nr:YceD family protein [Fervidibacillus albus]WAA10617.1 YceD family protein [Fervidibacillus albus]
MMKWSIVQLQKFKNTGFQFDETHPFDHLKERDHQIRSISPIRIVGHIDLDSKRVMVHLHITGEMVLPSSRTLRDVHFPIDIRSTEVFIFDSFEEEVEDEENVHYIQGERIDLIPVVEELILLEIPIQVYNEKDDQIPTEQKKGADWEFIQERDRLEEKKVDPRLADLAKFFQQNEDE